MRSSTDWLFRSLLIGLLPGWLVLFVLLPSLMVLGASFLTRDETEFVSLLLTLDNYRRLLDPLFLRVILASLAQAALATGLCLLIGYPFAWQLSRVSPVWRSGLLMLVVIPFWTNSLVRVYAVRHLLAAHGPLNGLLLAMGLIDQPVRLLYTGWAVVIGLVYLLLPFMILPLYASFEKLDQRLLEAASDLGASRLSRLRSVVIPLTLPGIVAGCLLVFLPALGVFYVTDVLGGARNLMIGALLKEQFLDARDWPFGAAASLVLIGLLGGFLLLHAMVRRRYADSADFSRGSVDD